MKLLFAIKRLEDMAGGAERVFVHIAKGLAQRGYSVEILSFDQTDAQSFYPIPDSLHWHKIDIGNSARPAKISETILRILSFHHFLKKNHYDLIIAFQSSMIIPMVFSFPHIPIIGSEHIIPDHYKKKPYIFLLSAIAEMLCARVTVVSKDALKLFPKFLQKKMVVVPNPVEHSVSCTVPAEKKRAGTARKILLCVGRLEDQKDPMTLLNAFARIANDFQDWDLIIRGEGQLRAALESRIAALSLQNRVFLPGNTKDIASEYAAADLFALSSCYESFGLVVAEAMMAGLPVIGFADCPGVNSLIVDGQNGALVPVAKPGDKDERARNLSLVLARFMADPDLRRKMGEQAAKDSRPFTLHCVLDQWESLLKSLKL